MKSKFWLAVACFLAPFTAAQASVELHVQDHWVVKIGKTIYIVEVIELDDDIVRIKYDDGMVGMANKGDVKWLTKLCSESV